MLTTLSEQHCYGGTVASYRHRSTSNNCDMAFSIYVPPQANNRKVPVLYYLAGLTCTHETFMIKAGAQQFAAEHGIMLVASDTSPRGDDVADDDNWDLGKGAGFYLNATQEPWRQHYQMYNYIVEELPAIIQKNFSADITKQGIFGHSMGGHGALVIALKNPQQYQSVSAFAPICAPTQCAWGQKAFTAYLGDDTSQWNQYDASELLTSVDSTSLPANILIDQGLNDQFLQDQLHPHLFSQAAAKTNIALTLNQHPHYDHSYYFIASMMRKHMQYHAELLR